MKDYVEKILHQDVQISPYTDMGRLPLSYRSGYDLNLMTHGIGASRHEQSPLYDTGEYRNIYISA